jgi:hypothetical protein
LVEARIRRTVVHTKSPKTIVASVFIFLVTMLVFSVGGFAADQDRGVRALPHTGYTSDTGSPSDTLRSGPPKPDTRGDPDDPDKFPGEDLFNLITHVLLIIGH